MQKLQESEGVDRSVIIDKALPVLRVLTWCAALAGAVCFVCGILTIVLISPRFAWPFTTGSGIWAGIVAIMQGGCGFILLKNFNKSFPQATKSWMIGFYTLGIIGMSVAPQHLTYSLMGLTSCASRSKDGKGVEVCNPDHHVSLLVVHVVSTTFGVVMEIVAITTVVYMLTKRRLVHLTGGQWQGNKCYSDCICCRNGASYNDI